MNARDERPYRRLRPAEESSQPGQPSAMEAVRTMRAALEERERAILAELEDVRAALCTMGALTTPRQGYGSAPRRILAAITAEPGLRQRDLVVRTGVSGPTLYVTVRRLKKEGRVRVDADKRVYPVEAL